MLNSWASILFTTPHRSHQQGIPQFDALALQNWHQPWGIETCLRDPRSLLDECAGWTYWNDCEIKILEEISRRLLEPTNQTGEDKKLYCCSSSVLTCKGWGANTDLARQKAALKWHDLLMIPWGFSMAMSCFPYQMCVCHSCTRAVSDGC